LNQRFKKLTNTILKNTGIKIFVSYTNLIEYQKNNSSKFDQIKRQINSIDYLVVPKALKSTWESECNQYYVKNIISFNEYKALNVKKKL